MVEPAARRRQPSPAQSSPAQPNHCGARTGRRPTWSYRRYQTLTDLHSHPRDVDATFVWSVDVHLYIGTASRRAVEVQLPEAAVLNQPASLAERTT